MYIYYVSSNNSIVLAIVRWLLQTMSKVYIGFLKRLYYFFPAAVKQNMWIWQITKSSSFAGTDFKPTTAQGIFLQEREIKSKRPIFPVITDNILFLYIHVFEYIVIVQTI